jgi:hypothetical protein
MTRRGASGTIALCCALMLFSSPLDAEGEVLSTRLLSFAVSDYRSLDGKRWIHMTCEYEATYSESMERLIGTLWDFPRSPQVFSRVEAVRVRSETGGIAITETRTAVRVLGLAFVSNFVFRNSLERSGPRKATARFEMLESDGSCLSTTGEWEFEDQSGAGGPLTLARYSIDTYAEPRFPGQELIMRGFGAADIKNAMLELGAGASRDLAH